VGTFKQGDHVGRYKIVSALGAGGMGVVYRAKVPVKLTLYVIFW
jgi:serine/threonine protein kinase